MSAHEIIQLVDHWNRPIGACERHMMRKHRLLHRATYVLVIDSQQRFCVQLRSQQKDYCPGYWDIAAGGVVAERESYYDGAVRELNEELGITTPVQFHCEFYTQGEDGGRAFGQLFTARWDGAIQVQTEEIDAIEWLSEEQIERRSAQMTADSLLALRLYQAKCAAPMWSVGDRFRIASVSGDQKIFSYTSDVLSIVDQITDATAGAQFIICGRAQPAQIISASTLSAWRLHGKNLKPLAHKL